MNRKLHLKNLIKVVKEEDQTPRRNNGTASFADVGNRSGDAADVAMHGIASERVGRDLESRTKRAERVQAAMESIKKRTYGQCVDCIEEKKSAKVAGIPIARLQADPLNSRCVPHQEKFESRRNY